MRLSQTRREVSKFKESIRNFNKAFIISFLPPQSYSYGKLINSLHSGEKGMQLEVYPASSFGSDKGLVSNELAQ